jgi:hypothetical protein
MHIDIRTCLREGVAFSGWIASVPLVPLNRTPAAWPRCLLRALRRHIVAAGKHKYVNSAKKWRSCGRNSKRG